MKLESYLHNLMVKKKRTKKLKTKKKKPKMKKRIKRPAKRRTVRRSSKPKPLEKKKAIAKPKVKKRIKAKKRTKIKKIIKIKKRVGPIVSDATIHKTKIRVIGIGGGGGSIISEIVSRIKRADFVVANTDTRALRGIKKVKRFQFGQDLTHGLGTGMNTEVGELAAQNEKEKIKKLFEEQDLCIIVICLGGGTGSGAGPIFAKISKKLNCLTYGIFTLPFKFEGEKKMEIARESLEKIKSHLNVFSVIPNERIFQIIDKDTPLKDALSAINERLAENLGGLIEMIYSPGLINIDFADLKTILAGRGRLAYLNTIEIAEPKKEEAAKKVISTPLYSYTIKGARGILYNVVGGKTLQLSEVSQISKIISDSVNKNAKIIFGISQIPQYQNKIKITLLATGCGTKGVLLKPARTPKFPVSVIKKPQPTADQPKAGKPVTHLTTEKVKSETVIVRPKIKLLTSPKKKKVGQVIQKKPQPLKKKAKMKIRPKQKSKLKKVKIKSKIAKKALSKKQKIKTNIKKKIDTKKSESLVSPSSLPRKKFGKRQVLKEDKSEQKIRRDGLQLKKVIEEEEKKLLEQEKAWETPAILRRKNNEQ